MAAFHAECPSCGAKVDIFPGVTDPVETGEVAFKDSHAASCPARKYALGDLLKNHSPEMNHGEVPWKYPDTMDVECVRICNALNSIPGIQTVESCCGHGLKTHRVFFLAETIEALHPILRCAESTAWCIEVYWSNGAPTAMFMLEGPIGAPNIPGGADDFAAWVQDDLNGV